MTRTGPGESAVGAQAPHVLREYALLADGERGALVGPRGGLVWMCFPRWDSDAVFSSLIGGAGAYAVTPRLAERLDRKRSADTRTTAGSAVT